VEWYSGGWGFKGQIRLANSACLLSLQGPVLSSPTAPHRGKFASRVDPKYGVSSSPRVVAFGEPVPKGGGTYRVGKPYTVAGRVYVPEEDTEYREEGLASWYGNDLPWPADRQWRKCSDMASLTAAHPTLPMPCYARVTNLYNGKLADRPRQ